jgi:hypothetical protein
MLNDYDNTWAFNVKDVAWVGGLLEGEGCFFQFNGCPQIKLAMTDGDTVERAACILGRKCTGPHPRKSPSNNGRHRKPIYLTIIAGARAVAWMLMIFPFLGARRKAKIVEVLSVWRKVKIKNSLRTHCPQLHEYSEENTYRDSKGIRHCIRCKNEKRRGKYQALSGVDRKAILDRRRRNYHELHGHLYTSLQEKKGLINGKHSF